MTDYAALNAINAVEATVGIILLLIFIRGPWSNYWISYCRQRLFVLRDDIFTLAARGRLDPKGDEYRMVRAYFNGAIRFAHAINVLTFVVVLPMMKAPAAGSRPASPSTVLSGIKDDEVRKIVLSKIREATLVQVGTAFARSPLGWVILLILAPIAILERLFRRGDGDDDMFSKSLLKAQDTLLAESHLGEGGVAIG